MQYIIVILLSAIIVLLWKNYLWLRKLALSIEELSAGFYKLNKSVQCESYTDESKISDN